MKYSLLYDRKELFPGSEVMSRRAFAAVSTKGFLRPFLGTDCFECLSSNNTAA